jgi:zinc protease
MEGRLVALVAAVALALDPAAAQVAEVEDLVYPPLPEFAIPQPERIVLANGLVVMLLEDHELPLVDATARIRTGSRFEPAEKAGLAALAGVVQRTGGTAAMQGDELDDFLENRAAAIETSIEVDSGSASMSCLADDLPEVLRAFAEVLRRPAFEPAKLEVAKAQLRAAIARQNDDPQDVLFREFDELVFGADSPYARSETFASVVAVTREDLVTWHRRFYHPNNVVLGLVGDFEREAILALVEELFGDWPVGPATPEFAGGIAPASPAGVFTVAREDVNQSSIAMGHLGIRRDAPDYYAVQVLNELFSGSMASRLFAEVRTRQGLAYAVSGGVGSNWDHPGLARLFMTTKTETTGRGIAALLAEARRLAAEPPTGEEVTEAKQSILASFVFNSDSTREVMAQQLTYELFDYPLDWLARYAAGIRGVTVEDVRRAAYERLHPERFAILVVGPQEGRDRALEEFGPVTAVDVTIPGL